MREHTWQWVMHNYPIEIHNSVTSDCVDLPRVVHSYFRWQDLADPISGIYFVRSEVSGILRIYDQMTRCRGCFYLFLLTALVMSIEAAKGGGRGAGRGRSRGRMYGSRMPILIPHRNSASAHYYENKDGAKIVKASHFELDYMLGRKITFICIATGFPRPEITWLKDGIELYHHKFFQVHEWPVSNDTIKSKMEIDPATQKDAGYYECQADNQYAVDRRGFRTDYVMISY